MLNINAWEDVDGYIVTSGEAHNEIIVVAGCRDEHGCALKLSVSYLVSQYVNQNRSLLIK